MYTVHLSAANNRVLMFIAGQFCLYPNITNANYTFLDQDINDKIEVIENITAEVTCSRGFYYPLDINQVIENVTSLDIVCQDDFR